MKRVVFGLCIVALGAGCAGRRAPSPDVPADDGADPADDYCDAFCSRQYACLAAPADVCLHECRTGRERAEAIAPSCAYAIRARAACASVSTCDQWRETQNAVQAGLWSGFACDEEMQRWYFQCSGAPEAAACGAVSATLARCGDLAEGAMETRAIDCIGAGWSNRNEFGPECWNAYVIRNMCLGGPSLTCTQRVQGRDAATSLPETHPCHEEHENFRRSCGQ